MNTIQKLKVTGLVHADWNPRQQSELEPEHPEMAKLVESIRRNGLLQPIGVWHRDEGDDLVIYGNRRLEAIRLAGIEDVEAKVYTGIDEATARLLTREENENRFGINPIADAKLLKEAVERGMNQSEIAAASGVSEATICRRMKLVTLDAEIVDALDGKDVDTKALELIAAYPADFQKRAMRDFVSRLTYGRLRANDVRDVYNRMTCKIDESSWIYQGVGGGDRLNRCRCCGMCTGNQRDLFGVGDDEPNRCLDMKCYKSIEKARVDELVSEATKGAEEVVMTNQYDEPFRSLAQPRKSKRNPVAWVCYNEWSHVVQVKWYVTKEQFVAEKQRKEREALAEQAKQKESECATAAVLDAARRKVTQFFIGNKQTWEDDGIDIGSLDGAELADAEYNMRDKLRPWFEELAATPGKSELFRVLFWDLELGCLDFDEDVCEDTRKRMSSTLFGDDNKSSAELVGAVFMLFGPAILCLVSYCSWADNERPFYRIARHFKSEIALSDAEFDALRIAAQMTDWES